MEYRRSCEWTFYRTLHNFWHDVVKLTRLQNLVKRKPRKMRASKDVHAMCTIALCHCFLLNMQEYTNIHADKGEV